MADIVATDVTYSAPKIVRQGRLKHTYLQVTFGNGTLTYPAAGIPLTVAGLGFTRNVDSVAIAEANANGFRYEWDKSANTIRILRQNLRTGSTAAADSTSGALAEGSNATEIAGVRIMASAIDTDYDIGAGKEALATHTPAATTLEVACVGW